MLQKTAKREFNDGFYTQKIDGKKQKSYIDIEGETVHIHPVTLKNRERIVDSLTTGSFFPKEMNADFKQSASFNKGSFDIDFFTIPLKLRPTQNEVPAQLNTNLNGAVYLGYRNDIYMIKYAANPLGKADRNINHFGFSLGAFTGIGSTFMSPTNTNNRMQQEYDGIVWSKGIAGIIAVNNFTIGIALGFDNLLDKNHRIWIYESKPWLGLAFGLNLN